jgi:hypothetical protein
MTVSYSSSEQDPYDLLSLGFGKTSTSFEVKYDFTNKKLVDNLKIYNATGLVYELELYSSPFKDDNGDDDDDDVQSAIPFDLLLLIVFGISTILILTVFVKYKSLHKD